MTDQTLTPGSTPGSTLGSTDGATALRGPAAPQALPAAPTAPTTATAPAAPAPRRTPRRRAATGAATAGPFRIVTANVQSFPDNAITLAEALDDLRRNAADGDVVLLQEIAARYRPWWRGVPGVGVGRLLRPQRQLDADRVPPRLFSKVRGPGGPCCTRRCKHLHFRRYMTHLRLRARDLRFEFHVTNLHLVAGAFNDVDEPDQDLRLKEWNDGIAKHRALVERLVDTGLPVVGGGDYNRQLEALQVARQRGRRQAGDVRRRRRLDRPAVVHRRRRDQLGSALDEGLPGPAGQGLRSATATTDGARP